MKIIEIKHTDDCFNNFYIKEIFFSNPITKDIIFLLGNFGKLNYFENFARPFYKVFFREDFYIKGVENNNSVKVLVKNGHDIKYITDLIISNSSI